MEIVVVEFFNHRFEDKKNFNVDKVLASILLTYKLKLGRFSFLLLLVIMPSSENYSKCKE